MTGTKERIEQLETALKVIATWAKMDDEIYPGTDAMDAIRKTAMEALQRSTQLEELDIEDKRLKALDELAAQAQELDMGY